VLPDDAKKVMPPKNKATGEVEAPRKGGYGDTENVDHRRRKWPMGPRFIGRKEGGGDKCRRRSGNRREHRGEDRDDFDGEGAGE
jgi:hypothetical protein